MKLRDKKSMKIKIGTRKSRLAVAQTNMFIERLTSFFPDAEPEIIYISTKGDKIIDKPLSQIGGKGIFVSEIELALQCGNIDVAVHSAKDLPVLLGENLEISGVLPRGNYRDVIVTQKGTQITDIKDFTVGTGSLRRRLNMKKIYNKVTFKDIRGNVDTRLSKLENGEYDAVILAASGLERLEIKTENYSITAFDYMDFLPAPCQGIIALESRKNDFITPVIQKINDINTFKAFETERCVIRTLNADCSMPVGAYSELCGGKITLTVSKDMNKILSGTADISHNLELAKELVLKL